MCSIVLLRSYSDGSHGVAFRRVAININDFAAVQQLPGALFELEAKLNQFQWATQYSKG
jgi:hypothetical protein